MKSRLLRKTLAGAALPLVLVARALALGPDDLRQIAFEQKIGQQISSALIFRNSDGSNFRFGAHFGNRPTLLVLGYYHCPMLCALINNGLINALEELPLDVGKDFDVVNLSIDQRETAALVKERKWGEKKDRGVRWVVRARCAMLLPAVLRAPSAGLLTGAGKRARVVRVREAAACAAET